MTLAVALEGRDGLVLASDSRGIYGGHGGATAQDDAATKTFELAPHVGVALSGAPGFGVLVVERAKKRISDQGVNGVSAAMEALREEARSAFQEWFPTLPPIGNRPPVSFLVVGYDDVEEQPVAKIFELSSQLDFAPSFETSGYAAVGIVTYAYFLFGRLFERDRTVREMTALGMYAISETADQDGRVGGPVQVLTVDSAQGCTRCTPEYLGRFHRHNERRVRALRASFYKETGL